MTKIPRLHVVLHQPEIPQNTGNIGRTCVAVDAALWLIRPLGFRLDASRLRRAGMDYWDHLQKHVMDDWAHFHRETPAQRFWYFSRFGRRKYTDIAFARGDALVFGSESRGLPGDLLKPDQALWIPMRPEARSLNLAASVAVAVYEAVRQLDLAET